MQEALLTKQTHNNTRIKIMTATHVMQASYLDKTHYYYHPGVLEPMTEAHKKAASEYLKEMFPIGGITLDSAWLNKDAGEMVHIIKLTMPESTGTTTGVSQKETT